MVRGRTHVAQRRKADVGIIGDYDEIAVEREIRSAGETMACDLSDCWLMHVPKGTKLSLDMFEIPAVFVDPSAGTTIDVVVSLRLRRREIVASAECGTIRPQDHAMHRSVIVGFPERIDEFR